MCAVYIHENFTHTPTQHKKPKIEQLLCSDHHWNFFFFKTNLLYSVCVCVYCGISFALIFSGQTEKPEFQTFRVFFAHTSKLRWQISMESFHKLLSTIDDCNLSIKISKQVFEFTVP